MITFNRLFAYMAEHDISRKDLEEKADISRSTILKLRQNKKTTTHVIEKICTSLGCSISDIIEYVPEEI